MSEILVTRNLAVKWSLSVKTIYLKNSLETFQKSIPFRNIYVKYLEKNSTLWKFTAILPSCITISCDNNRFTDKHLINQWRNMWISAFEENEFLKNILFSVHLFNQIRMQTTFLEISANFYNDWRWHGSGSAYLVQPVKYQFLSLHSPEYSLS